MADRNKKTVVLGASPNPSRYSYLATNRLAVRGYEVIPVGQRKGKIEDIEIRTDKPVPENVHTITLYMRAENQVHLYDYMLSLKPKRIIFNPGTENEELEELARKNNIETVEGCTLVMLSTGTF